MLAPNGKACAKGESYLQRTVSVSATREVLLPSIEFINTRRHAQPGQDSRSVLDWNDVNHDRTVTQDESVLFQTSASTTASAADTEEFFKYSPPRPNSFHSVCLT